MNIDKIFAESIACAYAPQKSRKVIALEKLDRKATKPAYILSYLIGIIALLFETFGCILLVDTMITTRHLCFIGFIFIFLGFVAMSANPAIHKSLLKSRQQKYALDISILAKEICVWNTF